ncbi:hypothetical protein CEXT_771721 [Caerostris extrusa]|uniref:Uncharacterized protein n=1 Tax=Caerostris extrusa TaxID=172846 RepID=A0AAV4YEP7_CAEEX|nr:hypothetical protein CEXT_771721 [Caerostris extrusa]
MANLSNPDEIRVMVPKKASLPLPTKAEDRVQGLMRVTNGPITRGKKDPGQTTDLEKRVRCPSERDRTQGSFVVDDAPD